jgi:hypothetical protein
MKKYVTFDDYYKPSEYNSFLNNLDYNNIEYEQYVCIRPPYHFYIYIDDKYLPVFLRYKIAESSIEKYMLNKIKAFYPNEKYMLTRKDSDSPSGSYEKYISPTIFKNIKNNDYACVFRYKNKEELIRISRELGVAIWDLGKQREWNLAFSYSKFIKSYIPLNWILLEKISSSQFSIPGEFEFELNYKKLNKVKLDNKYLDYPVYINGVYFPLKRTS